jgi:hypothetical protein
MITAAALLAEPASSSRDENVIVYEHASPKACDLLSVTSRGCTLGLGNGSAPGPLTR